MIKPIQPIPLFTRRLVRYFALGCLSTRCFAIATPTWAKTISTNIDSLTTSVPFPVMPSPSPVHLTPQQMAQRVVDGLPPPPPIPDLQAPATVPLPLGSGSGGQEDSAGELYMVYVNGDSPLLLEQVQQVEPTATIQPYEGQNIILVGMFDRSSTANIQVETLDQRGIQADVVSVSSVVLRPSANVENQAALAELPPAEVRRPSALGNSAIVLNPAEIERPSSSRRSAALPPAETRQSRPDRPIANRPTVSVAPPPVSRSIEARTAVAPSPSARTSSSSDTSSNSAYYVVIPGQASSLRELRERVILLGALPEAVDARDRPLGPHLLIGPFVDQSAATRWNRFFQEFGLGARIYYKR